MWFQSMYVKLKLAAHLLEPAGGRVCNSFLWSRLINPSLIWSSLVNIAIIKQRRYRPKCAWNCRTKSDPYPLAPEELKGSVAVWEIVRSTEDSTSFHGKTLPAQHLEQGQQPHPVLQVLDQVLHPHRRLSLAQVRVDPVDKGLPLDPFFLI